MPSLALEPARPKRTHRKARKAPKEKLCRKCGVPQPVGNFPFDRATQKHGAPCKACHAVAMKAFRASAQQAGRLREQERMRSAARRAARRQQPPVEQFSAAE